MKNHVATACMLSVALMLFITAPCSAQFTDNSLMVGPHIGLVGYAGAGIGFGGIVEKSVIKAGEIGPGSIAVSGRVDYFSFGDAYWSYTFVTVGAFAQYHYPLENKKLDPFAGLGLVYEHVGVSGPGTTLYGAGWGSGINLWGDAGIRYFLASAMAVRAQVGFGATWLVIGLDFGL